MFGKQLTSGKNWRMPSPDKRQLKLFGPEAMPIPEARFWIASVWPTNRIRFHSHQVNFLPMEKRMCRVLVIVALGLTIGTASAAMAADPIVGTWKLDVSKSKLVPSLSPPKAQTEVYRELASGQIELELTTINNEGASTSVILSWPAGGGVVQDLRGGLPKGVTVVETLLEPGDWYVTFLMDGKQVMTMHKVISLDRQTMRQTIKGLDPQGRSVQQIQVLRRQ
jgi:hypothetical protein